MKADCPESGRTSKLQIRGSVDEYLLAGKFERAAPVVLESERIPAILLLAMTSVIKLKGPCASCDKIFIHELPLGLQQ